MARRTFDENVYWSLPTVLVLVAGVAALAGGISLIVLGHAVIGSVVVAPTVLGLLVLAQEAARYDTVQRRYGRLRALSGYAGASLRTWSRASGRVARLRLESAALIRERGRAQYALGGAAYAGEQEACDQLIQAMRALDAQLAQCAAETARAIEEAQSRTAEERLAIRPTEIRRT